MASLSTVVDCLQTVEMHHSGVRSLDTFQSLEKESTVVLSVGGNNTICCWRIYNKPKYGCCSYASILAKKSFVSQDWDYRFLSVTSIAIPSATVGDSRSRLILAGDSQGYIHCFWFSEDNAFQRDNTMHVSDANKRDQGKCSAKVKVVDNSFVASEQIDGNVESFNRNSSVLKYVYKFKENDARQVSPVLDVGSFEYNNSVIVLSAGSNGMLAIWSFQCDGAKELSCNAVNTSTNPETLLFNERIHQCGMNCIDYSSQADTHNCFIVISGGDDNMFSANVFSHFWYK